MAAPWPGPRSTHAKFLGSRLGSAPCPARFRGPPFRTAQRCGSRMETPGGFYHGTEGLGMRPRTPPTRAWEPPPIPKPLGAAATANTHRVRHWAGPRGTRTAAPPRFRRGVSARHTPSGPPPGPRLGAPQRRRRPRLHGEGKRLRGDWADSGDGGSGCGSELALARARLCQRRTRSSLAPEPAWAVRRLLIGRSEMGADWLVAKGRLPGSGAPPLHASGC